MFPFAVWIIRLMCILSTLVGGSNVGMFSFVPQVMGGYDFPGSSSVSH